VQLSKKLHGTEWAFDQYEAVRDVLPSAVFPSQPKMVADLSALTEQIDTFFLDAFGVLNVGETAIPGAIERMVTLRASGKRLLVVSNSASYPTSVTAVRYRTLGFDFSDEEIISSRDALKVGLRDHTSIRWGVAALRTSEIEELGVNAVLLGDDPSLYRDVEGFILLSSAEWNEARQDLLVDAVAENPRPVLVGNPDIVAPRETGLSLEPGFYAHDLTKRTGCAPTFYGKPFSDIYTLASERLGGINPKRTAMVGDTLHTDVLGGAAALLQTVFVTDHGLFAGTAVEPYISKSLITPDIICATT